MRNFFIRYVLACFAFLPFGVEFVEYNIPGWILFGSIIFCRIFLGIAKEFS